MALSGCEIIKCACADAKESMKTIIKVFCGLLNTYLHLQQNTEILSCLLLFVLKGFVAACSSVVAKSSCTVLILIYDDAYQMNHKLFKKMK